MTGEEACAARRALVSMPAWSPTLNADAQVKAEGRWEHDLFDAHRKDNIEYVAHKDEGFEEVEISND